jgi:hypothetical protein
MRVTNGPLLHGKVVLVVGNGDQTVYRLLWIGALPKYQEHFLMDLFGSVSEPHEAAAHRDMVRTHDPSDTERTRGASAEVEGADLDSPFCPGMLCGT